MFQRCSSFSPFSCIPCGDLCLPHLYPEKWVYILIHKGFILPFFHRESCTNVFYTAHCQLLVRKKEVALKKNNQQKTKTRVVTLLIFFLNLFQKPAGTVLFASELSLSSKHTHTHTHYPQNTDKPDRASGTLVASKNAFNSSRVLVCRQPPGPTARAS